jgi:hypothetical protein
MRERVEMVGGTFRADTPQGKGATIAAMFPNKGGKASVSTLPESSEHREPAMSLA